MGHPPLVTPTSQIVGTQAVFNVLLGERYKIATNEVKDYFRGLYGRPPAPVNPEIQRKVIGDEKPITDRPADHIEPGLAKAKQELGALYTKEEDVLSYALFPQQAKKFLEEQLAKRTEWTSSSWSSPKGEPTGYAPYKAA
jgi:oxaloacetate decarboxylase alpha subunit